jgi:hypothetical protein
MTDRAIVTPRDTTRSTLAPADVDGFGQELVAVLVS